MPRYRDVKKRGVSATGPVATLRAANSLHLILLARDRVWYAIGRRSVASERSRGLVGHRRHHVAVYTAPAHTTRAMASDDGDFDTDLAAAPAKRMRYSFADEIAESSHFEAFGQRFTGFPSGECYGKCSENRGGPRHWHPLSLKHGGYFPVCVPTFCR